MAKGEKVSVARPVQKRVVADVKKVPVAKRPARTVSAEQPKKVEKPAQAQKSEQAKVENQKAKATKTKVSLTKKQIGIIAGVVALVVIILVGVIVWLALRKPEVTESVEDETEAVVEENQDEVDFTQEVTGENGRPFEAEYQQGSEEDYVVRFPNLQCEEGCMNVADVKLGTKVLTLGADYEVKKGSVIIILKEKLLAELTAGNYELTFTVTEDEETVTVGVKFSVKAAPICAEDEELKVGKCVKKEEDKKPEEKPSDAGGSSSTTKPSAGGNTGSTTPEQPAQKPDYNLNDRYLASKREWIYNDCDKEGWPEIGRHTFVTVVKYKGTILDLLNAQDVQVKAYRDKMGYPNGSEMCGGIGGVETAGTWEEAQANGVALDETKCKQYGLSCGRW